MTKLGSLCFALASLAALTSPLASAGCKWVNSFECEQNTFYCSHYGLNHQCYGYEFDRRVSGIGQTKAEAMEKLQKECYWSASDCMGPVHCDEGPMYLCN